MIENKLFKLSPLEFIGRPIFIKPIIDIDKEEEIKKKESLMKAFEDLPKPKPAMCRCMIEPKELNDD